MEKRLSDLMKQEEQILTRLLSLSLTQREIVHSDDMTRLMEFLIRKQKIMEEFEELQRELQPFRNIPPELRSWKDDLERRQTEATIRHCEELFQQILENDTQSMNEIGVKKETLEEQIRRVRRSSQINTGYAKQILPNGAAEKVRHFDVSK